MPTVTIDAAVASLNRHATLYKNEIAQTFRTGLEFENAFTPRACDKVWSAPNVAVGEVMQAYQWQFTPKMTADFSGVDLTLQPIKGDVLITAEDLEKFWDSWMVEWFEVGRDANDYNFPRYLHDQILLPKILEEMNRNAWAGEYAAPTPGSAGDSINSVDGYKKFIADAITAGDLTEYATGIFVDNTMVDQIEGWCDSLPVPYRDAPGTIYMSKTLAKKYWRDYRTNFGTGNGVENNANPELRVDMTGKNIMGMAGMEGSSRIFFFPTVTNNAVWGTRRGFPTYPVFRYYKNDVRSVKVTFELYRFYGFEYYGHLFVNDQA